MMRALYLVVLASCSFAGVRGPSERVGALPAKISCTESALLPGLDALGGALALGIAGGGVVLEQASDDGSFERFTRYYAGPLAAAGILYFIAASFGNTRVTWCTDAKERMAAAQDLVRPVR